MTDLITRLRTACSPESPLGKLCSEAADALEAMQWQPMDTCPEMTPVQFLRWGEVYVGWWNPYADVTDYPYQILDADTTDGWNSFNHSSPPSHWAPIVAPALPTTSDTTKLLRSAALDELGALDGEQTG